MTPSRWLAAALAVALSVELSAQQQPVFRSGVDLITLDVTVVDKDGKPVAGLKAEDFVVTLEGQERPVRALDYLEFGAASGSDVTSSRQTTNQQSTGKPVSRGGRIVLILFDDLSYRAGPGKALLVAAQRMLGTLDLDDLVGVATTSGMGPVISPTRDRSLVMAALQDKRMMGRLDDTSAPFYIAVPEAIDIERGLVQESLDRVIHRECPILFPEMTKDAYGPCPEMVASAGRMLAQATYHRAAAQMAAYQHAIAVLKSAPAPRVIIALSNGVAAVIDEGLVEQVDAISRAAAESGVQFYALNEVPDDVDGGDLMGERAQARREEGAFLGRGIQTVASAAGGEAFHVIGTPDRFFKRIVSETSGLYRIGVEMPLTTEKRRFTKAKVSVRRAGLSVHTSAEALAASVATDTTSTDEKVRARLAQGGAAFGVPIALGTALRRDPAGDGQLQLGVNVQVPSSVSAPLLMMFGLVDESGKTVQMGRKELPPAATGEDYQFAIPVPLAAGRYRLRMVVGDAGGNVGSVEHPVVAELPRMGAFSASDLITTWAGADGRARFLALEKLPDGAATLRASLELYLNDANAAPPDVIVRLALIQAGEETPVVERDLTPTHAGLRWSIAAELPVDGLKPGAYTIRATILEAGTATGTVSTTFRKID